MDHLESYLCEQLDITVDQIMSYRAYDDGVAVVVDYGIAGGKKYTLPLPAATDVTSDADEAKPVAVTQALATGAALKYAASHNIDLTAVVGTGANGRITVADVKGV